MRLGRPDATRAELVVEDTGLGLAPERLATVFTRVATSPNSPRHKANGLGLGLFITRQIVIAHGGTTAVRSTVGEGTIFTVTLPLLGDTDGRSP